MTSVDRDRIQAAVREILSALGEDLERHGLADTPRRVAELAAELFAGVGVDPATALGTAYDAARLETPAAASASAPDARPAPPVSIPDARPEPVASAPDAAREPAGQVPDAAPVLLRDIAFRSVCEHHLLPFEGLAHVAYLPAGGRVAGLGSVVAVVEAASSRPQLQERLGDDIAEALERGLGARGVLVVLDARHGCVTARGPRQTGSSTVTLTARGALAEPAARAEITALIAAPRAVATPGSPPSGAGPAAPAASNRAPAPTTATTDREAAR